MINVVSRILNKNIYEWWLSLSRYALLVKTRFFYKYLMKHVGKSTCIGSPLLMAGLKYFDLGNKVTIWNNCRIEVIDKYGDENFTPEFIVGDFTQIHQNAHITCSSSIRIGKNVVIASNVTITDINHEYSDIETPINWQPLKLAAVEIGDQSYVYNNCVIVPGVKIGRHCVIGANSVVMRDVPDYCVAVGSPAKIVKRFSKNINAWEKVLE